MRTILWRSLTAAALGLALGGPVLADADPSVQQVYQAASSGRLDEAQQMMDQVLRDHPSSSKAHYVQSELYAREGKLASARAELARAEQLDPGLTKENPRSVAELRSQLRLSAPADRPGTYAPYAPHFRWGLVLIVALVIGVCWMLFRRRTTYAQYPAAGGPMPPSGSYGPGGYGPGPMGGGLGSTVAGGLAGGLAAGAGIVAGEELAHHFLDGQRSGAPPPPPADEGNSNANSDMGGTNFGVDDASSWNDNSGGSWDDGSGGGDGGGGGDWT
jgi:hypothetical protein